jgi:hypothetical protein
MRINLPKSIIIIKKSFPIQYQMPGASSYPGEDPVPINEPFPGEEPIPRSEPTPDEEPVIIKYLSIKV